MVQLSDTDLKILVAYLDDAARLYSALPLLSIEFDGRKIPLLKVCKILPLFGPGKCISRAHMIKKLSKKLKSKLQ